jgi:hypothetical protein
MSQYDQAPYGVKFIFHVVAGPQWTSSSRVRLCVNCGDERPGSDYMVTSTGWAFPKTNSTGYSDLVGDVTTAQGTTEQLSPDVAARLSAGDSADVSSTLVPSSQPPDPQQVVVTIEMPDGTLATRTFTVSVGQSPGG